MATKDRGLASMSPEKRREIASLGGKAAQQSGKGHSWTAEQSREAGKKGVAARRKQKEQAV